MFEITYETWKNVCNMYFSLGEGSLKAYLQWFPFSKLSTKDKEEITSEKFYDKFIRFDSFVINPNIMYVTDNFLQKGDGSFRNSTLVSPLLYLILQAIGKEISNNYCVQRASDISVYYAGNYIQMRPKYKVDYDDFFKEINICADGSQYFIKMDIADFFYNIDVNILINMVDDICNKNKNETKFLKRTLSLYENILLYCGNGHFPLIENSLASSYLATIVYLDAVDIKLHKFISELKAFDSFHMVRYVDDLYIIISTKRTYEDVHSKYIEILNMYSSILKEYGLTLNAKKNCLRKSKEIYQELKKSLYNEFFNGKKNEIESFFPNRLQTFLNELSEKSLFNSIDIERYNELINVHFSCDDIEFIPSEVFNYFVYENESELKKENVQNTIVDLINQSTSFISFDPKRLMVMIMKTHNDKAIKGVLNQLFIRNREGKWDLYDTIVAISYLIQSEFKHIDLLNIIKNKYPKLYKYCENYCKCSFYSSLNENLFNLSELIGSDTVAYYLYFMYLCETKRNNYMVAYSYFKSFFDRLTADFDFANQYKKDPTRARHNYNSFYKCNDLIRFYAPFKIENSDSIIKKANKLRNQNPIDHASSKLLDTDSTAEDLQQSIKELTSLIIGYINWLVGHNSE